MAGYMEIRQLCTCVGSDRPLPPVLATPHEPSITLCTLAWSSHDLDTDAAAEFTQRSQCGQRSPCRRLARCVLLSLAVANCLCGREERPPLGSEGLLAPIFQQGVAVLVTEALPSLGVLQEQPLVKVDAGRIEQVLANVLSNAVKYSPQGGLIEVQIEAQRAQHEVLISIRDGGMGIPRC